MCIAISVPASHALRLLLKEVFLAREVPWLLVILPGKKWEAPGWASYRGGVQVGAQQDLLVGVVTRHVDLAWAWGTCASPSSKELMDPCRITVIKAI